MWTFHVQGLPSENLRLQKKVPGCCATVSRIEFLGTRCRWTTPCSNASDPVCYSRKCWSKTVSYIGRFVQGWPCSWTYWTLCTFHAWYVWFSIYYISRFPMFMLDTDVWIEKVYMERILDQQTVKAFEEFLQPHHVATLGDGNLLLINCSRPLILSRQHSLGSVSFGTQLAFCFEIILEHWHWRVGSFTWRRGFESRGKCGTNDPGRPLGCCVHWPTWTHHLLPFQYVLKYLIEPDYVYWWGIQMSHWLHGIRPLRVFATKQMKSWREKSYLLILNIHLYLNKSKSFHAHSVLLCNWHIAWNQHTYKCCLHTSTMSQATFDLCSELTAFKSQHRQGSLSALNEGSKPTQIMLRNWHLRPDALPKGGSGTEFFVAVLGSASSGKTTILQKVLDKGTRYTAQLTTSHIRLVPSEKLSFFLQRCVDDSGTQPTLVLEYS